MIFISFPYRGVLKTRWHARVQGGFEGYVRDIWRTFGGHLGVFEATRRLPRGKIKNSFTVLFLLLTPPTDDYVIVSPNRPL